MIQINEKSSVKSLTFSLHEAMKANPKMKVSEFRELFSKQLGAKDWNALLGQFDDQQASLAGCAPDRKGLNTGFPNIDGSIALPYYPHEDYSKEDHGILTTEHAIALIELFYSSEFWFLAPFMNSTFNTKEQALRFVKENPNYPLSVVMSTNNEQGSVSLLVNSYKQRFYFHDEDDHTIVTWYSNIESVKMNIADSMTYRAKNEHNNEDSYVIPFIEKDHELKDYVSDVDYIKSVHGELPISHAKELISFCDTYEQYSLGKLDGQPFSDKKEAEEFISYFPNHPLILIAHLGHFDKEKEGYGFAMNVYCDDDGKTIIIETRDEMGGSCFMRDDTIYLLEKRDSIRQFLIDNGEIKEDIHTSQLKTNNEIVDLILNLPGNLFHDIYYELATEDVYFNHEDKTAYINDEEDSFLSEYDLRGTILSQLITLSIKDKNRLLKIYDN